MVHIADRVEPRCPRHPQRVVDPDPLPRRERRRAGVHGLEAQIARPRHTARRDEQLVGAHLVAARAIFEVNPKWDAGLGVSFMFSDSLRNVRYAVGPEIGRVFTKNVRVGLGYNLVGFTDRDFDAASTSQGLFLSMRIKFDENLFKWASFKNTEAAR